MFGLFYGNYHTLFVMFSLSYYYDYVMNLCGFLPRFVSILCHHRLRFRTSSCTPVAATQIKRSCALRIGYGVENCMHVGNICVYVCE